MTRPFRSKFMNDPYGTSTLSAVRSCHEENRDGSKQTRNDCLDVPSRRCIRKTRALASSLRESPWWCFVYVSFVAWAENTQCDSGNSRTRKLCFICCSFHLLQKFSEQEGKYSMWLTELKNSGIVSVFTAPPRTIEQATKRPPVFCFMEIKRKQALS